MSLNLDFNIECISNGYIVTGNDSTKLKCFYRTLNEFLTAHTEEELQDTEKYFREHDAQGEEFRFTLSIGDSFQDKET